MGLSQTEMMRQLHAYAHAEMRNRGLEAAAQLVERQYARSSTERFDRTQTAAAIRALKTDPNAHLTAWWSDEPPAQTNGE
ncbi:hypothetical protein JQ628_11205 [Bradyrhizobium lablabi]|uniref:hypothetical protein n=1 Tax=Bradyrhizobium lablabi TaxID=722472 RepID=UPI001BABAC7F|nr:hypothetical protein [Bradyrhizobium lablabi]MBR1122083.1 hypothetical protein [Bradyrhizobium lablabi]